MRTKPIPQAYRIFFRQIGLDPDVTRIPSEEAAVARLLHGEFRSAGLIPDACLVALIETGVPVWALDADVVDEGGLGIRTATADDLSDDALSACGCRREAWWSPTAAPSTRRCSATRHRARGRTQDPARGPVLRRRGRRSGDPRRGGAVDVPGGPALTA